jgi:hypothetical protein
MRWPLISLQADRQPPITNRNRAFWELQRARNFSASALHGAGGMPRSYWRFRALCALVRSRKLHRMSKQEGWRLP